MGQQISTTHTLRTGEDTQRFKGNRKSKAYAAKTSRGSSAITKSPARGKGQRVESEAYQFRPESGEASKAYFMRCPDLGIHHWEQVTGPVSVYAAVKMKLARVDHDLAWPVALAKTHVTVEVRYPNNSRIMTFRCKGSFFPKYECERLE
jgi:hypothetical protein